MNEIAPAIQDPERLAALHRTCLLDSKAEEEFDRLTRLARRALNVPATLISLVDEDRQFFKSTCGLKEPWATKRETPLSHSFCQYVVASREPFVVPDTQAEALVRHNLARRALGVAAYLGYPLETSDGYVLGSFCAIDTKPHEWSEQDIQTVADFAGVVMSIVELRTEVAALRPMVSGSA